MSHPTRRVRPGFTLVELLVVIGIIVLLLGILLPVVGGIRRRTYATASQAAVQNLAQAIERYRQDFNAYPGIYSNAEIHTGVTLTPAGQNNVTSTENMVLSMLGGLQRAAGTPPPAPTLDMTKIGGGPIGLNPIPSARKQVSAYMDAAPGTNTQAPPWDKPAITSESHGYNSTDTFIPEFIDKFPDPMPIIYLRANVGRPNPRAAENTTATADNTGPYNFSGVTPYVNPAGGFPSADDFPPPAPGVTSSAVYFRSPSVGNDADPTTWQPRQKDSFILIGPGVDRKYGTIDDQTNFGPLK